MNDELIRKLIEVNEVFYAAMIASMNNAEDDLIEAISKKDCFIGSALKNV